MYLLDSSAVSDVIGNPRGAIRQRIARVGVSDVYTSIIVAADVRYGVANSTSLRLSQQAQIVLDWLPALALEPPVDEIYGTLRADLERAGNLIGPNNLFVAAHALARNYALATNNICEFSRIPRLKLENGLG